MKMTNEQILSKLNTYISCYEKLLKEKNDLVEKLNDSEELNMQMVEKLKAVNIAINTSRETMEESKKTMELMRNNMTLYENTVVSILNDVYKNIQKIIDGKIEDNKQIEFLQNQIDNTKKSIKELNDTIDKPL